MIRQVEWKTVDYLSKAMAKHRCHGMSLCEIRNYEIVWQKALGTRTAKAADVVLPDTLFQAGSISKTLFALAVMHLVQEKSLDLDKDVNEYLKTWQLPARIGIAARVTLRQLLSHTASTTVHGFPGYEIDEPIPSLLQILEGAAPANTLPIRIDGMPGQRYQYSGGGSCIAQLVIEEITQCPFPELMHTLVLGPVGMSHSGYLQPLPTEWAARAAHGHDEQGLPIRGGFRIHPELAAAGLWSTPTDLALLGIAVMQTLQGQSSPLGLRPATLAAMVEPQLPNERFGTEFAGLGWFCSGEAHEFCIGHSGENEGFVADLSLLPHKGDGLVIMANALSAWPLIEQVKLQAGFVA